MSDADLTRLTDVDYQPPLPSCNDAVSCPTCGYCTRCRLCTCRGAVVIFRVVYRVPRKGLRAWLGAASDLCQATKLARAGLARGVRVQLVGPWAIVQHDQSARPRPTRKRFRVQAACS